MTLHHEAGPKCPLCDWKLTSAHLDLAQWFWRVKAKYNNAHVSWAYRNAEEQAQAFEAGRSRVLWPNSKHNHTDEKGNPCSLALDLFLLDEDGVARFTKPWYSKVNSDNLANKEPIEWGGGWLGYPDADHFQLKILPSASQ